jgi:hypothetical protein
LVLGIMLRVWEEDIHGRCGYLLGLYAVEENGARLGLPNKTPLRTLPGNRATTLARPWNVNLNSNVMRLMPTSLSCISFPHERLNFYATALMYFLLRLCQSSSRRLQKGILNSADNVTLQTSDKYPLF